MSKPNWTTSWTYFEGAWHEGNTPIIGSRSHASWLGSVVFDGARAFEGVVPDVELHCARVNDSARHMGLSPCVTLERWLELVAEGINRFPPGAELYIRPMYWAEGTGPLAIAPAPGTENWCLAIYEVPMTKPNGFSVTLSPFRRPSPDTMPLDAKAACLYPNNARAIVEAQGRGFDNALLRDLLGNIAEFANSNVFLVRGGEVATPVPNGTFLDGITRRRVIGLLREAGRTVIETSLRYEDFLSADEIFSTGNASKVVPATRIENRVIEYGPVTRQARELYWEFAHSRSVIRQGAR